MTTLTERIPLDEINRQARDVHPGRTLLTVIAGILFGIGWLAARVFSVAWLAFTWSYTAVKVGWEASHGPSRGQQIATLTAQVEHLQETVRRLGGP